MKILLTTLNSKYVHSNLALKYLYTVCAEEFSDVEVREFTINLDQNFIYNELLRANYDLVCFSAYIWNIEEISRISKDLKQAKPEMKILLGGPEVSYSAPEFMKGNTWVDFIITGEGEYPLYRFMEELHAPAPDFFMVPALCYRQDGKIYVNQEDEAMDFNVIPFPYNIMDVESDRVVYYESTRGCPFRCSYCISSLEKSIRALSLERVKWELGYFLRKGVNQVKFVDRTFNYDKNRAFEIIKFLEENDNGKTSFHLEICADLLDEKLIELLGEARKGQFELEIGIQSTNAETLEAINRSGDISLVLSNTRKLVDMGNLHVHVDLIAGLPYETYEIFMKSFNDVYSLKADVFQLGFLKVLKGTSMENQVHKYNIKYRQRAPYEVISTDFISAVELVKLHQIEEMLDIYYNRGGFEATMDYLIENFDGDAFKCYEAISEFYYEKGFQNRSHSKDDNYRILLQFIEAYSKGKNDEELFGKGFLLLDSDAKSHMDELNYKRFTKKSWRI